MASKLGISDVLGLKDDAVLRRHIVESAIGADENFSTTHHGHVYHSFRDVS